MKVGMGFFSNISGSLAPSEAISEYNTVESVEREYQYMVDLGIYDLVMLYDKDGIDLGKKYFNQISVVFARGKGYTFENVGDHDLVYVWDEPDAIEKREGLSDVYDVVRKLRKDDYKVDITFHSQDMLKDFVEGCDSESTPDVIGCDHYPYYIPHQCPQAQFESIELFRDKVFKVRDIVKGKLVFYIQAFGRPNVWRYPTIEELDKMFEICDEAGIDITRLFLWSTSYKAPELLTGIDVASPEYHQLIKKWATKK